MGGRKAKPIELHLINGNKRHLTKKEIEDRKKQESKLKSGTKKFKASPQVKNDPVASAVFKKLQKLYKKIEFVEGLDEQIINRYCILNSEIASLTKMSKEAEEGIALLQEEFENGNIDILTLVDRKGRFAGIMFESDKSIMKKRDMLIKLEDRLFLNPVARIKNVPKKEPEKKDPLKEKGFGNV